MFAMMEKEKIKNTKINKINKIKNIYHQILSKINIIIDNPNTNIYDYPLLIIEIVEEMTQNHTLTSKDKLNLAKDTMEYCLCKNKINDVDKNNFRKMFPKIIKIMIDISNKKIKIKTKLKNDLEYDLISDDLYLKIRKFINDIYHNQFIDNYFSIIIELMIYVNQYKNLYNTEKKKTLFEIVDKLIEEFECKNDIQIFYDYTSLFIENIFKIYKNRTQLNSHKLFFKYTIPIFK